MTTTGINSAAEDRCYCNLQTSNRLRLRYPMGVIRLHTPLPPAGCPSGTGGRCLLRWPRGSPRRARAAPALGLSAPASGLMAFAVANNRLQRYGRRPHAARPAALLADAQLDTHAVIRPRASLAPRCTPAPHRLRQCPPPHPHPIRTHLPGRPSSVGSTPPPPRTWPRLHCPRAARWAPHVLLCKPHLAHFAGPGGASPAPFAHSEPQDVHVPAWPRGPNATANGPGGANPSAGATPCVDPTPSRSHTSALPAAPAYPQPPRLQHPPPPSRPGHHAVPCY